MMGRVRHAVEDPEWAWWSFLRRTWLLPGQRDYRRFIVLSRSRTGSNLLVSYLNSHPRIHAGGELLARTNGREPNEILRAIFGPRPPAVRAQGFKIFYYHPVDADGVELWEELRSDARLYVVHLRRENMLRTQVSRALAAQRGAWTTTRSSFPGAVASVRLDADEIQEEFEQTEEWIRWGDAHFAGHPRLDLSYEELVSDPTGAFCRVADFLGVERRPPRTEFRRQNPQPLVELIENYAELKDQFASTRWSRFFEARVD